MIGGDQLSTLVKFTTDQEAGGVPRGREFKSTRTTKAQKTIFLFTTDDYMLIAD